MFRKASDCFILFLALILAPWLCAQKNDDVKQCAESMVPVHDLYKQGGEWDTSFIDTSNVVSNESALKTSNPVYSGVSSVQLGLKGKIFSFQTIRFSKCSRDAAIEDSRMFVSHVFAFKRSDRIFAYILSGSIQNLKDGTWQSCMCGGDMLVYDPDGTGRFSHLILYSSGLPYVPEWVRGDSSIKSK